MDTSTDFRKNPVDLEFWTSQFDASDEAFVLCRDHLLPGGTTFLELPFTLSAADTEALKRLTAGNPDLLRTVLIAATALAASVQTDNRSTTVLAGTASQAESDDNPFLPIRVQIEPELSFRGLLGAAREAFVRANVHASFPVARFLNEQAITPSDFLVGLEGEFEAADLSASGAQFLVTLADSGRGRLHYNSGSFTQWTAERLIEGLLRAFSGLAPENLNLPMSGLTSLTEADRIEILNGFNATERDFPSERVIHSFLEHEAARNPDRIAIRNSGLTYGELNSRANRLAWTLRKKGVGPGSIVGVCLRRSELSLLAIFAVLKAGGAYLPIEPTLPAGRIQYILEHSKTALTLTVPEDQSSLNEAAVIDLSRPDSWDPEQNNPEASAGPDDPCYVIYTSGSTGRPKGVVIEHRAIVNRLAWMQAEYQLGPDDVILHKTPFTFDVSVWEIFWWSMAGASVATLPSGGEKEPEQIAAAIKLHGITTMHFVPSMLSAFLHYTSDVFSDTDLLSLRYLFASGEALSVNNVQMVHKILPQALLVNLYGPTEAAVDVSYFSCDAVDSTRSVPIGRPISNIKLIVRGKDGTLAPLGVPGELCIAGVGLARGYLHAAELTEERFVPGPEDLARIYRTGDLARWLPTGVIEYLGRIDTQVKIRGYRIELSEIEHLAQEVLGVVSAAATAVDNGGKDTQLCLYIVGDPLLDRDRLQAELVENLPSYMVPQHIIEVPTIPTSHNGKRDLSSLPGPDRAPVQEFQAPETDLEILVAAVWAAALNTEQISRNDSFFALGGDSIVAIRVTAKLKQEGFKVTVADVFANPSLADFALALGHQGTVIEPVVDTGSPAWPCTALQNGMIYHSLRNPGSSVYHDVFRFHFKTPEVIEDQLKQAWSVIQKRHPVLQARFDLSSFDSPHMVIMDEPGLPFEYRNLADNPDPAGQILLWTEQEKTSAISFQTGLAYRICLFRTAQNRFTLGLSFHHALFDGWSVASLIEEWAWVYHALLASTEPPEQSPEYLQQLSVGLENTAIEDPSSLDFWRTAVDGLALASVPQLADPSSSGNPSTEVEILSQTLEPALIERLEDTAKHLAVPLKTLFLAAYLRVQSLITNEPDVVVGLVTNGRPEVDGAEAAVGMFLNTVPLRTAVSAEQSWRSLIAECFAQELRVQEHRRFPLPSIQKLLGGQAAYEVIFNYTNFHVHADDGTAEQTSVIDVDYFEQTDAPLVSYAGRDPYQNVWSCRFGYNPRLYPIEQIQRYLGYFHRALKAIAADCDQEIRRSGLLDNAELALLQPRIARPQQSADRKFATLIERFRANVVQYGDRTASSCAGRSLSYRELDRASDAVASEFRRRGVVQGDFVCLILARDLEMVISLLAVLKLGAAYIPVDPHYPEDRIRATVEDAKPSLVVAADDLGLDFGQVPLLSAGAGHFDELIARPHPAIGDLPLGPDSAAYVIYTSGSTGRPKGVVVSNGNVLRLFSATEEWFRFSETDVWSLYHSFAFDFSVWELWGALLSGGEVVVVPYWTSRSMPEFANLLQAKGVTMLSQTPSAFTQLAPELIGIAESGKSLALRSIVFGGEALDFSSLEAWFSCFGDDEPQLINMYGITETTVHVTYRRVLRADVGQRGSLIGEPIPDLSLYLVDQDGSPVPIGTPGEIVITGAGLATGYLNRPEETRRRFVEIDLGAGPERGYRSGDLGRRLPNGEVEYLGRNDNQVKIQGYRIELGDIETAISSHPGVVSSKVLVVHRADGSKALAGYALATSDPAPDTAALREYLSNRLPGYMVPIYLFLLDGWPLTINGKVDLKALPSPESIAASVKDRVAGRTRVEKAAASVWATVLGLPEVGIDDAYYDLGGDSLQGIRLIGALQRQGIKLTLDDLFRYQSIRQLAENSAFSQSDDDDTHEATPFSLLTAEDLALLPEGIADAYPMTDLQQGMIYHSELDPEQGVFHDLIRYRIKLPFNDDALRNGLLEMLQQHELLRTSMELSGFSVPLQLVHSESQVDLQVFDLSELAADSQTTASNRWFDAEKSTSFDWRQPTLMRFFVQILNRDEFFFSVSFHHSIIDGWSFSKIISRFLENYRRALHQQNALEPEPAPMPYSAYVSRILAATQDPDAEQFWRQNLEASVLPALPVEGDGSRWAEQTVSFSTEIVQQLEKVAQQHQVSLRHICQAIHFKALSVLAATEDVVSGVFSNGRPEHEAAERMVGLFLNILPQRVSVPEKWADLIANTAQADYAQMAFRRYPYAAIQKATGSSRLVNTAFNFVNFSAYSENLGADGAKMITDIKWFEHSDFALLVTFNADPFAKLLNLSFNTDGRHIGARSLAKITRVYQILVDSCLGNPVAGAELDQILLELSSTDTEVSTTAVPARSAVGRPVLPNHVDRAELRRRLAQLCAVPLAELDRYAPDSLASLRIAAALAREFDAPVELASIIHLPIREWVGQA